MNSFTFLDRVKNEMKKPTCEPISNNESCNVLQTPTINIQVNNFAVISVPVEKGPNKNFIAQVVEIVDDWFQINFLKKSYGTFFFPPILDISWVQSGEITHILKEPVTNKRGQLIFPELKDSELKIF